MKDKIRLIFFTIFTSILFTSLLLLIWALGFGRFTDLTISGYFGIILFSSATSGLFALIFIFTSSKKPELKEQDKAEIKDEAIKELSKEFKKIIKHNLGGKTLEITGGKVFYRLDIKKQATTKQELIHFVKAKSTDQIIGEIESGKINEMDFNIPQTLTLMFAEIKLDITIKIGDIISLLFHTQMSTDQFNNFTYQHFR